MFSIYSLTPAPWGDDYRFVEAFDTEEDAKEVLAALEKVTILFNYYKIIKDEHAQIFKQLRAENKRLLKCESDLRKIHEEYMTAVKESDMCFQHIDGKLMLLKRGGRN